MFLFVAEERAGRKRETEGRGKRLAEIRKVRCPDSYEFLPLYLWVSGLKEENNSQQSAKPTRPWNSKLNSSVQVFQRRQNQAVHGEESQRGPIKKEEIKEKKKGKKEARMKGPVESE